MDRRRRRQLELDCDRQTQINNGADSGTKRDAARERKTQIDNSAVRRRKKRLSGYIDKKSGWRRSRRQQLDADADRWIQTAIDGQGGGERDKEAETRQQPRIERHRLITARIEEQRRGYPDIQTKSVDGGEAVADSQMPTRIAGFRLRQMDKEADSGTERRRQDSSRGQIMAIDNGTDRGTKTQKGGNRQRDEGADKRKQIKRYRQVKARIEGQREEEGQKRGQREKIEEIRRTISGYLFGVSGFSL